MHSILFLQFSFHASQYNHYTLLFMYWLYIYRIIWTRMHFSKIMSLLRLLTAALHCTHFKHVKYFYFEHHTLNTASSIQHRPDRDNERRILNICKIHWISNILERSVRTIFVRVHVCVKKVKVDLTRLISFLNRYRCWACDREWIWKEII